MNASFSPQAETFDFSAALYGSDYPVATSGGAQGAATPLAPSRASTAPATDPHDRSDKGPSDIFEDPVPWLIAAFAIGAGIIGFRFHWGPGAKVSASVDVADEISSILGQVFIALAGIAAFKVFASKTKIRALQEFAAFI